MRIGAILTCASDTTEGNGGPPVANLSLPAVDILGASLIERTLLKLRALDTLPPIFLQETSPSAQFLPRRSSADVQAPSGWEDAVAQFVRNGVDTLCLARIGSYTDLDLQDLLRFHLQVSSPVTQAYGTTGALNVAMVDASRLRTGDGSSYRKILGGMMGEQRRFNYLGYVNKMSTLTDYHRLVQDALSHRCDLHPAGKQIQQDVWAAERSHIDLAARVSGPAFIGRGSRVRAGCVIRGGSSIERNCEIDCGSLIESSCILQDTYIGIALDVRRSVVNGRKLFHLDRNVEISLSDDRLVGTQLSPSPLLAIVRRHNEGSTLVRTM